jgi:spermidine/putrescine-binding protein
MANSLKLSRRSVLKLSGGAIAATTVGLPHIAQAKPDQLVISDGGGILTDAFRKGYYDTFTSKTGIKIVNAPYAGIGKVKLMVESNNVDIDRHYFRIPALPTRLWI